jgi:EF-P beta-lysylation protein EpmB
VLPLKDEGIKSFGFLSDPVGDLNAEVSSGVLQKYHGRVLLITTGACAVHCRYCFRRHFPYANSVPDKAQWQQTLAKIKNDKTITEVILSGGDPLMLSDERLKSMCQDLANISHITTLRFHTRVPILLPERLTPSFIKWLSALNVKIVMVLHANHANELDSEFLGIMNKLSDVGVTLLNQSVLLKNINDDADKLVLLSQRLFDCGILPYYLHQLDRVQGAAHFEVSDDTVQRLQQQLRERLPGYLMPRFVREVSGKRYKQPLE